MEELFASELHQAGIAVMPLHGTAKWKALLEADALWRFTKVPVAVMFDNVSEERAFALAAASDDELAALTRSASEPNEVKDLASLFRAALQHGRDIHPLPNPSPDIFVHLDEDAVRSQFPKYPGHQEAERKWQKHHRGSRDAFLKERYGIEKAPEAWRAIAARMAANGMKPAALAGIVTLCAGLTDVMERRSSA